uniref:Retrotransposon protein, putative, Ty1-copia subclass n=1 Tax=Oryza sativa subsp. japonica TaxID=39947 RepID=Q2QT04_ORYSJ|nr:retrotransposon protein, putative, Ty1-copia subclass [Oryza sativa Japonica Group]
MDISRTNEGYTSCSPVVEMSWHRAGVLLLGVQPWLPVSGIPAVARVGSVLLFMARMGWELCHVFCPYAVVPGLAWDELGPGSGCQFGLNLRRPWVKAGLRKEAKAPLESPMELKAKVEAVGDLLLELANGFTLLLRVVFYVPSLQRNLISVSKLDFDGYDYHFGNVKCELWYNNACNGLAVLQDELYLLSLYENVNVVSSLTKENKKRKRTPDVSSKLWHFRLCHISRGRIERLVKNDILPPLEFSDLEQCIECIKGKFVKSIKKGAKRSAGILEIIHTDICDPFPVKSMDGYDSFITFTHNYSRYGYIYPIKERSEALDKFKIFKAEVENQHDVKIKIV